jgi:hypothetical protein
MKRWLVVLAVCGVVLTGCSANNHTTSHPTQVTLQSEAKPPVGALTRIYLYAPEPIESGWQLKKAVNNWNANGKTLLVLTDVATCMSVPLNIECAKVVEEDQKETSFTDGVFPVDGWLDEDSGGQLTVHLNIYYPDSIMLGITCHELGHLLGLGHPKNINTRSTCMGGGSLPSPGDLKTLQEKQWTVTEVERIMESSS